MITLLIRTVVLYIIVMMLIRMMGKRTIAELQVSELVITLLISDIAAVPMQESGMPLLSGVLPIIVLAVMEIFISYIMLKSRKIYDVVNGNPVLVVSNGKPLQKEMEKLRLTCADLMESLRKNGIFDINEVKYAVVETDGTISVLQNNAGAVNSVLISDGELCSDAIASSEKFKDEADRELRRNNLELSEVFMLLRDENGKYTIIRKDKKEHK